jgi:hypothetical protein
MEEFSKGMVVRHATLGIGRIVALEPTALHVFFLEGERREAMKLRTSAAAAFLTLAPTTTDERLDQLPTFALDPASGRYAPERVRATSARKAKAKKR